MKNVDFISKYKKVHITRNGPVTYTLNTSRMGVALQRAQAALDAQIWNDVKQYMPLSTGNLIQQTEMLNNAACGEVYFYSPAVVYGHYQYEGVVYVDPYTGKGAFYNPTYGFWSRPGVKKIPSDRKLKYTQPNAQAKWGEVAYYNHKDTWAQVAKNAFKM